MAEKTCPMCAEKVQQKALVCKHCGHKFSASEVKSAQNADAGATVGGCLVLLVLGVLVYSCTGESSEEKAARQKAELVKTEDDRRKGFHCLSGWDGSHSDFVAQVKRRLRDPESFEHDSTNITPVNTQGKHNLIMRYRAKNGFGGMNVGSAIGEVDQASCAVTVISAGDGS